MMNRGGDVVKLGKENRVWAGEYIGKGTHTRTDGGRRAVPLNYFVLEWGGSFFYGTVYNVCVCVRVLVCV